MADSAETITSCLNLMRRLPPKDIENSLAGLLNLVPNAADELLQRVDQASVPTPDNSEATLRDTEKMEGEGGMSFPVPGDSCSPTVIPMRVRSDTHEVNLLAVLHTSWFPESGSGLLFSFQLDCGL